MSNEHYTRAPPLECRLVSASMEIDDDDEDVIQVTIEVANEAAMPIGGLDIFIQTSDSRKVESDEGISSLGPGLTRKFTFEFRLQSGNWTFMLRSPSVKADLGPYDHDFTHHAEKGRVYNNAIGTGMFTDAFTTDLGDFGNVEERGIIDSSSIKMTSYFGENSAGGATAITVGNAPVDSEQEDAPRIPPWQQSADALLSAPTPSRAETSAPEPVSKQEEIAATTDLLAFSKQVTQSNTPPADDVLVAATPPPLPPTTPVSQQQQEAATPEKTPTAPPASPPVASPSTPPTKPPSGPPTGPPSGPPSKPPSGPPSKPPTKPPSGPPTGPPSGPPSKPPSGPPSKPPSGPPTGPPSGPPSKPPSGPPKSKKPSRPPM